MATERLALVVSTVIAAALGAVALVAGLFTGSGAILLDGAFNLCFFGTALFTLRVARLLERPDDERYPFGYVQFEPLINMIKGLLIIGVGTLALFDAILNIVRGGQELAAGLAVLYAAVGSLVCLATYLFLRRAAARTGSPLVKGDVDNWAVNTAITAGMLLAFILALLLERAGYIALARLVDPVLVIFVVLLTLFVPVRMVKTSLSALLQRSPAPDVVSDIAASVRAAVADMKPSSVFIRALRPGRTTYVLAHVVLEGDVTDVTVPALDGRRADITAALSSRHAPVVVDVVFTADRALALPTTGHSQHAKQ